MRMQRVAVLAGLTAVLTAPLSVGAQPGSPNTTPGAVVRVTQVRIKPGHADAFWADIRQHLKPIYDAEKQAGVISDYLFSTKSTTDSPEDWSVSIQLVYPNWAALDGLNTKTDPITLAHYGTAANRTAAGVARTEHGTIVRSYLIRRQTVNPWK